MGLFRSSDSTRISRLVEIPHPPGAWKWEVSVALLLTFERLVIYTGIVLLVLSSYAWWGSPSTPLTGLWKAALVCFGLVFALRLAHQRALLRLLRMTRKHVAGRRDLHETPKQGGGTEAASP